MTLTFYNRRLVSIHLDLGQNCYEVIQLYFAYRMDVGDYKYQLSVARDLARQRYRRKGKKINR